VSVTVLLPVYNAGQPLRQAIESILRQDHRDFELLIIDDASGDDSARTIREFADRDARIRTKYHARNIGLSSTLNEGLELATHDLVARMDQDDESLPNRLRVQETFMRTHPEVVAAGSFVYHMGATRRHDRLVEFATDSAEIRERLPHENPLYHPSVIMRRREILELGGYRDVFKNAEDYDLWLRASRHHELSVIAEPLLRYRFSVHGMTLGRKWEQLFFVYFAQAANEDHGRSLDDARRLAEERLAATSRERFLVESAQWTLIELSRLRLWRDVATLGARIFRDFGIRAGTRVLRTALETWLLSAYATQRLRFASLRRYLASQ
jgi:glycosyltransferase involved in cell wall biosynthesis